MNGGVAKTHTSWRFVFIASQPGGQRKAKGQCLFFFFGRLPSSASLSLRPASLAFSDRFPSFDRFPSSSMSSFSELPPVDSAELRGIKEEYRRHQQIPPATASQQPGPQLRVPPAGSQTDAPRKRGRPPKNSDEPPKKVTVRRAPGPSASSVPSGTSAPSAPSASSGTSAATAVPHPIPPVRARPASPVRPRPDSPVRARPASPEPDPEPGPEPAPEAAPVTAARSSPAPSATILVPETPVVEPAPASEPLDPAESEANAAPARNPSPTRLFTSLGALRRTAVRDGPVREEHGETQRNLAGEKGVIYISNCPVVHIHLGCCSHE